MKLIRESLFLLVAMTILTGVIYPLFCFGIGSLFFKDRINGSIIAKDGKEIGSSLIAQKFKDPKYFFSRPSSGDYATVPSGASNKGPTSKDLVAAMDQRKKDWQNESGGKSIPADLLFASGSGLDPHLSPEAVRFQSERIASVRKLDPEKIKKLNALIDSMIEEPTFGFLGKPRINILLLNLKLDAL
ncbi:MAG: potassium-transporting ATPase subunit KdpC [Leptospira sp.]|nr:potassium-transporting ATPase subunit KdpC [Leptospira sp.]